MLFERKRRNQVDSKVFDKRNTFERGATKGIKEGNRISLSMECHTMALNKTECKANPLSPKTKRVEIRLKLTAVGDGRNLRINFDVISK